MIVDEGGDIVAIIDWEECLSTVAPEWELSIALHDLTIDEKHAFIEGYGLGVREVEEMAPLIKAFNILNYHQAIAVAIDTSDYKSLDEIKLRLKGSLDLYRFTGFTRCFRMGQVQKDYLIFLYFLRPFVA